MEEVKKCAKKYLRYIKTAHQKRKRISQEKNNDRHKFSRILSYMLTRFLHGLLEIQRVSQRYQNTPLLPTCNIVRTSSSVRVREHEYERTERARRSAPQGIPTHTASECRPNGDRLRKSPTNDCQSQVILRFPFAGQPVEWAELGKSRETSKLWRSICSNSDPDTFRTSNPNGVAEIIIQKLFKRNPRKNCFIEIYKNLVRYKSKNNFVAPSK